MTEHVLLLIEGLMQSGALAIKLPRSIMRTSWPHDVASSYASLTRTNV
eukprot:CAMPEP_0181074906 /NCGR_PEP_ID=MMETSP1070-20121207/29836_1 /TAXON_ID=265543 /ORGANISM="Minutocellus polymorphus, Strain NH13" /LENGTH=47 /DNA_ID= /DNA_START= /DNA_END= /DNA_ORIENTATION=